MELVEQHIITQKHYSFKEIDHQCFLAKNLYNYANYIIRQEFIKNGRWIRYNEIEKQLRESKQIDYISLPNNSSQQILMLLDRNWKSFFQAIKIWRNEKNKFLGRPKLPKYKVKDGRSIIVFTYNQCRIKDNFIHFPKRSQIKPLKTKVEKLQCVRIIPKNNHYIIEIIYRKEVKQKIENNRFIAIDLGVNNLCTITSNDSKLKPIIINGRHIKSINQFYNKKKAELQLKLPKNKRSSKMISQLSLKRNNKIKTELHIISKFIVQYCHENDIGTIVIGKNKNWKQECNIGKRNNQNFIQIPFETLISQISYKAELEGISVKIINEAYTSKCDALSFEEIKKHENYLGKRIKRGLFQSSIGKRINADVNGSLNILRKVAGDKFLASRGFVVNPVKISCGFTKSLVEFL